MVLNNRTPKPAVLRPAVERMLKRAVDVEIAFDGPKPDQAALTGTILSMADPRSEISRGAHELAGIITDTHGKNRSPRLNSVAAPVTEGC